MCAFHDARVSGLMIQMASFNADALIRDLVGCFCLEGRALPGQALCRTGEGVQSRAGQLRQLEYRGRRRVTGWPSRAACGHGRGEMTLGPKARSDRSGLSYQAPALTYMLNPTVSW
jgi:hypothetical protein